MPTQLQLEWPEREIDEFFLIGLKFSLKFDIAGSCVYFAEIEPHIKIGNSDIKYIHFIDFTFFGDGITFSTPEQISISFLDDLETFKLKILKPELVPLLDDWRVPLASGDDECFVQLFFYPQDDELTSHHVNFVSSFKSKWNMIRSELDTLLQAFQLGQIGLSVGEVKKPFEIPDLVSADSFFKALDSYKKGSKFMVLVISSFDEPTLNYKGKILSLKGIPSIPKDLILRKISMLAKFGRDDIDTASRLLLKALFCGAIPIHLFTQFSELLESNNADESLKFFRSEDFEKSVLDLNCLNSQQIDYEQMLYQPLQNLTDHLFNTSNEATIRSLFWDQVLNGLFLYGQEGTTKNYRLSSEWMTRKLFPKLEDRKIDFIASIEPGQKRHPIFIVEAGVEEFDSINPHKDFSKLINVLSLTCISMARDLASKGKTPENARVYGLWIGGMKFQFCVAHPVITKRNDSKFDIHTIITYEDDWIFDLFLETSRNPRDSPVIPSSTPENAETIQQGLVLDYVFSNLEFNEELDNVFKSLSEQTSDIIEIESIPATALAPTDNNEHSLYKGTINYLALKRLHAFIEIIKKRIDLIVNEIPRDESDGQEKREFNGDSRFGFIDSSRESSVKETPMSNRIKHAQANRKNFYHNASKSGSVPKFRITKESLKELEILRKLSLFPDFFAILYSASVGDNKVDYQFERLFPLVNFQKSSLSPEIHFPHPHDSITRGSPTNYKKFLP